MLGWPTVDLEVTLPKRPQRIPELLTRGAVAAILAACDNPRYRTSLTVCYGCGLRLSEVLALRVKDIDGERRLLRTYWRRYRPDDWPFAGRAGTPLSPTGLQKAFTDAKRRAGVTTVGGIHGLRHAYATHQLAGGLSVERLQRLMGHRSIQTTLRYVHWLPSASEGEGALDLIAQLGADHG